MLILIAFALYVAICQVLALKLNPYLLQDQYTPLYIASAKGFNDMVKSLIAANADVNCVCKVSCFYGRDGYCLHISQDIFLPFCW